MSEMSLLEQQVLRVILLDARNRVQAIHMVYQCSLNTTIESVRVIPRSHKAIRIIPRASQSLNYSVKQP